MKGLILDEVSAQARKLRLWRVPSHELLIVSNSSMLPLWTIFGSGCVAA
jgi:hypothetical protein